MARSSGMANSSSKSVVLIAFLLSLAALYFGRQIFIPLALAFVFSFLLAPAVLLLEKIKLRRAPAVLIVMLLGFALVGAGCWTVARQLVEIMDGLPGYKTNLDEKIKSLHASKSGNISKVTAAVQDLNRELAAVPAEIASGRTPEKASKSGHPIPVQVAAPPSNFVQDLRELLGPMAEPTETAVIVIIFTLFMMMNREDLRNRAIRLAGRGKLSLMTQALDDAAKRLSRYLLLQCLVNASYGVLFGTALHFIGVPHALLWGVSAGVVRFVPYFGPLIAVTLPILMSLAVFPGWRQAGITLGAFFILELAVSNIVEPLLYGAHTGISSLAILVAAVFWATIWGPVGLILSTPLTVCLVVLGRHVPQLKFLEVVLGDEPVLPPPQCFYQRLLALDVEEARSIADSHLEENSLQSLYQALFVPALKMVEQDHQSGSVDESSRNFVLESVREFVEEMGERGLREGHSIERPDAVDETAALDKRPKVVCVAVNPGADELISSMIAQLLRQSGILVREQRAGMEESKLLAERVDCEIVCVSSTSPFAIGQVRAICKAFSASEPKLRIVMGLWSVEKAISQPRLGPGCSAEISNDFAEVISLLSGVQAKALRKEPVANREDGRNVMA